MSFALTACAQLLGIALLAAAGWICGLRLARAPRRIWLGGFLLLLVPLLLIGIARKFPQLEFVPPCLWLMAGRSEFALLAFLIPALLSIPAAQLPTPRQRLLVNLFAGLCLCSYSVLPFLMPALSRDRLQRLVTQCDPEGICSQGTGYTCGPAASVTVLRRLGVPAEEGALAVAAHSNNYAGTPPDSLCAAIGKLYGDQGVSSEFRYCRSAEELQGRLPAVAVLKFGTMVDHYVAVLDLGPQQIVVGDPLYGKTRMSRDEFDRRWRHCVIFLRRQPLSARKNPGLL